MTAFERGDIVRINFSPHLGHEQGGERPALIISPSVYNHRTGLILCCPITSHAKRYPFEVPLPQGLEIHGVVLCDQVKSFDSKARRPRLCCKVPAIIVSEVIEKLSALFK